ncbi:MAG: thioredoxin fold domain-containing protein [Bacteroidota bacterium]|nr:thioredoxin fold domain-containing protein [Bacteroidota bacterium]
MKRVLLVMVCSFLLFDLQAQTTPPPAEPAYVRNPDCPPVRLLEVDSVHYLTKADIKKNRKILLMFFSPECEHCKHQIQDILADFSKFKDIEIVMATYQPFDEMKTFYNYYRIGDHPNIKIGRDEKFFLVPYYKIQNLPYLALYDRKGQYITHFEGNQKVETLMNGYNVKKD